MWTSWTAAAQETNREPWQVVTFYIFRIFYLVNFYAKPQVVKTVRAAQSEVLSVTRRLRGVRVVHLVRDPRARLLSMREAFHGSSEVNIIYGWVFFGN